MQQVNLFARLYATYLFLDLPSRMNICMSSTLIE